MSKKQINFNSYFLASFIFLLVAVFNFTEEDFVGISIFVGLAIATFVLGFVKQKSKLQKTK
ncbi:hypothetical protein SG34_013715 [Thalassomonas viridans]|uniref:Uncharacterized protein n=1 Tax=Thalassomonas viridans TaxID=137584 RepID=A0AAE9Z6V9_9GAMM|nr:hypothetical protein [Thalassomonas viridans]WDE07840.1 hypothetical protein SG34_013715 [Thalassomonas viridans]